MKKRSYREVFLVVLLIRLVGVILAIALITVAMRIIPAKDADQPFALAATLIQCYATRTGDGCASLSEHATMAECRKLASEYQKFDTRDLRVKGVPAVVSYQCAVGNAPRSDR